MQNGAAHGIGFDDEGNGPPVVFLHGMTWDRRIWQPVIARLRDRFRCVCVDLPGHGKSDDLPKTDDYRLHAVAARLHRLLLELEVENPALVGHSLGGAIASFYAAHFPVRGVINLDQLLRLGPMMAAVKERRDLIWGPDFPAFWNSLMETFGLDQLPAGVREWAESLSHPRQQIVLNYWDQLFHSDPEEFQAYIDGALRKIGAPYVALHGSLPDSDYAGWMRQRMPGAEIIDLATPCHFPHLLDPDRFAAMVRKIAI
ncbi:MAG TPA: alpha/beta fold hydrolase [Rhizomicrobium sp.]|nr:alpha/beta fold hydrolase [Rhizomicrobium sp.]